MTEQAGLTVVTWNAQGSQGLDIAAAASALSEFKPDLVLLQEVQRRQVGALRLAMHATDARWRFKHWPVKVPSEGLGVISTLPLHEVHSRALAHPWELWNWRRRIAVHFAVEIGARVVRGIDVHLGAGIAPSERSRQARLLGSLASNAMLIGGDLNAEPQSEEFEVFADLGWSDAERRVHADRPRPSTNWRGDPRVEPPTQRLDYVLIRDSVEVVEAFVPEDWVRWAALSDHVPVVARLRV